MTRWTLALVVFLTGCPPPGSAVRQPPVQPGASAEGGCPAADAVYVASFMTQDPGSSGAAGGAGAAAGGHTGWVLPLHDLRVDSIASQPEFAEIDPTTAGALGVPAGPGVAWLMLPGQQPCRATVGSYYAAAVDSPSANVTYGVELSGCPAPPPDQQQDAEAIALVSAQPPSECQVLTPQPVAGRVGETDAQQRWQRPTKETPIPAAVAELIPPHDCRPPACETLWAFAQVDVANRPVAWAGAVNWLTIPPGTTAASQCDWKAETFAGFFVAGPDGRAVKVTEGQDHPLLLTAVLADSAGPKALLAEGAGEYTTYDLTGGGARVARHLVWLVLGPDAYAIDERIGPQCSGQSDRR
jgi:hypothetical protein